MMKEKSVPEKTVVIDIKVTRKVVAMLACILVLMVALIYQGFAGQGASASGEASPQAGSDGMRKFYLTQSAFHGDQALTACAVGYHMASIWEIIDPSNLKYNTSLGQTRADSGQGPVTGWSGWVRTGFYSTSNTTSGRTNCNAWSTTEATGSWASLSSNWENEPDFGVWNVGFNGCAAPVSVWCVED